MTCRKLLILLSLFLLPSPSFADLGDIQVRGFGSIVAGVVVDGERYVADYPNVGIYKDYLDLQPESRLGLQATVPLHESIKVTAQLISRGANDFEVNLDWFYLTFDLTPDLNIQAGRMRMPVYKYSEFMDVGFAYDWIRVPSDTYSLDAVQYNGLSLNWMTGTDDIPINISFFTGAENVEHTELLTFIFGPPIAREYKNIIGIVFDSSFSIFNLRVSYTEAEMLQRTSSTDPDVAFFNADYDVSFFDVALSVMLGPVEILGEYNEYDPFYESYFVSGIYRLDDYSFYVTWSEFKQSEGFEIHDTTSLGMRYNLNANLALKVDISSFNDTGLFPVPSPPNTPDSDGDAVLLSTGIDFIF